MLFREDSIENMKKYKLFLILSFILAFFIAGCNYPQATGTDDTKIDVSDIPIQTSYAIANPILKEITNGECKIFPVANYKLSGTVVSKKYYWYGWQAKIAPVDLAFVWGKLTEAENDKFITYSQSNRWYYWKYKSGSPFDNSYIGNHSSNNHIIPANENILLAVKSIKKKQKVILEGYLVNIKGKYKSTDFWWNSSVTRSDTGDGSCEVFYVRKVKIDNNVYE